MRTESDAPRDSGRRDRRLFRTGWDWLAYLGGAVGPYVVPLPPHPEHEPARSTEEAR